MRIALIMESITANIDSAAHDLYIECTEKTWGSGMFQAYLVVLAERKHSLLGVSFPDVQSY